MFEYGAVYQLIGPDGTTVTFNDGTSGLWLEDITGFDSPNVRMNIEELPEADGAIAGDSYYGARPVTMTGSFVASSAANRNTAIVSLNRATNALRSDITLKSQPTGLPAMQATARLENRRITGAYAKKFFIALTCPDHRYYSQAITTVTGLAGSQPGAPFPTVFPVDFGGGTISGVSVVASNQGNIATPPRIRVWGPCTNPTVTNVRAGLSMQVSPLTLVSGQYVDIDVAARTVTHSNGTNLYDKLVVPPSRWWELEPGGNTVQAIASSFSTGFELDLTYRDAWA